MNQHLVRLPGSWSNPVRTGTADDGRGVAGTIHPVNPAVAARLREMMAREREQRPRTARSGEEILGNLLRAAKAKREAVTEETMTKMTDDQVREAHSRYIAGVSYRALEKEYGVRWQTLQGRFGRMGLEIRPPATHPNQKLSDDQVREAATRLRLGVPLATLAREYGVDRVTLRQRLERAGLWLSAKEQRRAAEANPQSWTDERPGIDYHFVVPASTPALVTKNGATPLEVVQRFDEAPLGMVATALGVLAGMRDELAAAGIQMGFRLEGAGVRVDCA